MFVAFTASVAFLRHRGWSFYFIYLAFMVHWCGTFVVFTAFVAFIRRLGCPLFVAFRVVVTFMGHWGGTLAAFTAFVLCMECWGWKFVASTAFEAFMRHSGLVLLVAFRVFVVFMGRLVGRLGRFYSICGVYGVLALYVWHLGLQCLAFVCFFMLSIGGCLRVWHIGAQASPSHEPLLSELGIQLGGPFGLAWGLMAGGRGFASHGGATLSRGWLCQRWKPLDISGTHLH